MLVQAEASIMYLGLNCTHCTGPVWSALKTHTLKNQIKITLRNQVQQRDN